MGNPQALGALILGVVVILIAPAMVWALVVGGLVRIVRERAREGRPAEVHTHVIEADQGTASQ